MKVEFLETVDVSGTTHIGVEEIECAIREAMIDVEISESCGRAPDEHRRFVIHSFANTIHECLEAIPDEAIASGSDEMRRLFSESLLKHAGRFAKDEIKS